MFSYKQRRNGQDEVEVWPRVDDLCGYDCRLMAC